jgi:hypothetical protein
VRTVLEVAAQTWAIFGERVVIYVDDDLVALAARHGCGLVGQGGFGDAHQRVGLSGVVAGGLGGTFGSAGQGAYLTEAQLACREGCADLWQTG